MSIKAIILLSPKYRVPRKISYVIINSFGKLGENTHHPDKNPFKLKFGTILQLTKKPHWSWPGK